MNQVRNNKEEQNLKKSLELLKSYGQFKRIIIGQNKQMVSKKLKNYNRQNTPLFTQS